MIVKTGSEISVVRQRLDEVYNELHQNSCVIRADFAVAVAVCILVRCGVQLYRTGNCLVQQNTVGNIYTSVQIDIAVQNDTGRNRFSCTLLLPSVV